MLFRITYKEPDGETGTLEIEADDLMDAYRKGRGAIPPGANIQGRPTDITPAEATGASGPDADKGRETPPPGGGGGGGGGEAGGKSVDQRIADALQAIEDQSAKDKADLEKIIADLQANQNASGPTGPTGLTGPMEWWENPELTNTGYDPLSWSTNDPSTINYQTGAGPAAWGEPFRRQMIEAQSPFGSFIEGISQAFGGGGVPGGYQGQNYLESLYSPAATAYGALQTLGNKLQGTTGEEDFGVFAQQLFSGDASPRGALGGLLGTALSKLGSYDEQGLAALPTATQNRIREMIMPNVYGDNAAEGWRNIRDVVNLAEQAQQQRFSPMALQAMRRGQGGADELWADFTRQRNAPGSAGRNVGFQNFARFVQDQFGL